MAFRGGEAWFVIDTVCCVVTASRHGYYHIIDLGSEIGVLDLFATHVSF